MSARTLYFPRYSGLYVLYAKHQTYGEEFVHADGTPCSSSGETPQTHLVLKVKSGDEIIYGGGQADQGIVFYYTKGEGPITYNTEWYDADYHFPNPCRKGLPNDFNVVLEQIAEFPREPATTTTTTLP